MVESNEKDLAMVEASIAAFVDQLTSSQDQLNLIKNHISALKGYLVKCAWIVVEWLR